MAFGGKFGTRGLPATVRERAAWTLRWQCSWMFNYFDDRGTKASVRGGVPWLKGPAAGLASYVPPWDPYQHDWPAPDDCNFNPAELAVAVEVRNELTNYIRWKSEADRNPNVFRNLEWRWDSFRTGLRAWNPNRRMAEHLIVVPSDVEDMDKGRMLDYITWRVLKTRQWATRTSMVKLTCLRYARRLENSFRASSFGCKQRTPRTGTA